MLTIASDGHKRLAILALLTVKSMGFGPVMAAGIHPFQGIGEVHRVVHRHLLQVGSNEAEPRMSAGAAVGAAVLGRVAVLVQRRVDVYVDVVGNRQRDLLQVVGALRPRRAASRADCTAGKSSEIKTAMIAITTRSSMSVNPRTPLHQAALGS